MSTFLEKTAKHLMTSYGVEISDLCIVLPNKRAGLFLKQELSKLIQKPIWLPPIVGAEDLIEKLSNTEIIDNLTPLFELYEVYAKLNETPESFEEFSKWGQLLLHDFNEIDRYLIPTDSFFKTINDVRAIEVWNLGDKELSTIQINYLAFWKQMDSLYQGFHEHLISQNKAYQGKAFRLVAEQIISNPQQFIDKNITWKKIIFIGFNALTLAEETIITELKKQHRAEILWDADEYYMNHDVQESGMFLRSFKQKPIFSPFNWITNKFNTENKSINIIGIPQSIGQAKYLSTIFNELKSAHDYRDTSIVLAEETLLVPVLESIPAEISSINVTMGYPIKNAPLSNFFEIYFTTLLNANRFGKEKQLTYHYKDITKLLQLPFSNIVFGEDNCRKVIEHIVKHNWVFIQKENLDFINSVLKISLTAQFSLSDTLDNCLSFVEIGKEFYSNELTKNSSANLELEYLFHFSKLFNQIKLLSTKYPVVDEIKTFIGLYRQLLVNITIELYGEPLQGLQVMGMLETRNIDFKNIILLSSNEGILPKGKTFNSFIPFDVKKAYNLPTHIEKDAVYAYHFYRLIQNAENVYILYNTETNEFGSGEKSRFVIQLENELAEKPNMHISQKIITYPTTIEPIKEHKIEKTNKVISKIEAFLLRGVSPSALNTYLNCPLDFYYQYVLNIREIDEVEETVESSSFGTYIHNVLEKLYKPFELNKLNLTEVDLKKMLNQISTLTKQEFLQDYSVHDLKTGKNFISIHIAEGFISSFINNEIKFLKQINAPLFIKALEKPLEHQFDLDGNAIVLKGKIDRIDSYDNVLRILDYKTGKVDNKSVNISKVDEIIESQKTKVFQVLFYAYLYSKSNDITNTNLHSGIIALKKMNENYFPFTMENSENITPELLHEFESLVIQILEEIINPKIPFEHRNAAKYCTYC